MLWVYNKIWFLFLLFIVLVSILIINITVLDINIKNKIILNNNICHEYNNQRIDFNYTLRQRLIDNEIKRHLIIDNNFETSFVNISDDLFIYSAFETINNIIVLIGLAKNNNEVNEDYNYYNYNNSYKVSDYHYFCSFGPQIQIRTEAVVEYLPESHDYYYSAIKVQCKLPVLFDQKIAINRVNLIQRSKQMDKSYANNKTIESEFVFIARNHNKYKSIGDNNSNYRLDKRQEPNARTSSHSHGSARPSASPKELVVCVRPLFGNISAINLLEFIAYYRLHGINRLVFYNSISTQHMSNQTKQLFQLLSSVESVEVLPFLLPRNDNLRPIIHANGQITSIHDCLYRFGDYIQIHIDFDEYLMPFNNTIKEYLLSQEISQSSALVVSTVLFCNEFNQQLAKRADPLLITNFNRQKTVWPHEIRSKVIIMRAELISQMGIHNIWKIWPFYSKQKSHPISYSKSNQILIYHYRKCCDMIQPYFANIIHFHTINDYIIRDESMKAFVNRVKQFIDKYIIIN